MIRTIFKGTLFAAALSLYFVTTAITHLLLYFSKQRVRVIGTFMSFCAALILRILAVRVEVNYIGSKPEKGKNYLVAFNHLSYLDVLVLASVLPCRFVTSIEVKRTPFLGWLCGLGACVYVERRSRGNIQNEIGEMAEALRQGYNVAFCPEATSSNGERVLPFKKSLMNAAMVAEVGVLPACLNYASINGGPVTRKNRDCLFWYGDMSFLPHILKVLSLRSILVKINFLEVISDLEDHRQIAALAHERISGCYVGITD